MASDASASRPVTALRDQFGDPKPPDITRKITACVACRKQKIKCHMNSEPPCTRCRKRGLSCTVNKSLQMILEGDGVWKHEVDRKIKRLEKALCKLTGQKSLSELESHENTDDDLAEESSTAHRRSVRTTDRASPTAEDREPHSWEIVMDDESGPAAIPGSIVSPVTLQGSTQVRTYRDIIAQGLVTLDEAQACLDLYRNRLDHFLYRILGDLETLDQVRAASPLLLAAICAVGALHGAPVSFDKCYQHFVSITAAQTFSRRNTADEVRGLVVAAFWLSGISWTCIGLAVRIATENGIQLHRSIFKALSGDRVHYLRTRLYYLVFVCDHHFSICYGRPPLTTVDDDAVRASMSFLGSEHAGEDDARLISQVQFWRIGTKIYKTFGVDVDKPMEITMIEPLRRLALELDGVRADWTERFSESRYVGNYPRKGVGLHYHFAKLYLYSHAFRGIGKRGFRTPDVALDIDELASSALLSATSIIRAVVSDSEIQSYLNGLPTYFDVMIAFAVVFVLKVSSKYANLVRIDTSEVRSLVKQLVVALRNVTADMHPRHLLVSIANGAEKLLDRCCSTEIPAAMPAFAHVTMSQPSFDQSLYDMSSDWNGMTFDNFYMGEFDFLSAQDPFSGFPPDMHFQMPPPAG